MGFKISRLKILVMVMPVLWYNFDLSEPQFLIKTWKIEVGSFMLRVLHSMVEKLRAESNLFIFIQSDHYILSNFL